MSEKTKSGESSPERRHWGRKALASAVAAGALVTGLMLNRDGADHGSEEVGAGAPSSQPVETTPQSIENGTDEERERAYREEISATAQNLAGRVASLEDESPTWTITESRTARTERVIPSRTVDGQDAAFRFELEVDLDQTGQPDLSQPRNVQVSMEQGMGLDPDTPPYYEFELKRVVNDVPGGEWSLEHHGLAGTAAGHPDGTDQTIELSTLEPRVFSNGLENGNYLDSQWLGDASHLAINVIDAAQAGDPVDPGLVAL